MRKYIGTKQIEAEPMTKGDAFGKHLLREGIYAEDLISPAIISVMKTDMIAGVLKMCLKRHTM